jgi:hypothetical protein
MGMKLNYANDRLCNYSKSEFIKSLKLSRVVKDYQPLFT